MKKLDILFEIVSLDSKQTVKTIGEYHNRRIKFIDEDSNTNYIVFHKDTIEYYKRGSVDMKYKFKTNMITEGYYTVSGHRFTFSIQTKRILNEEHLLEIEYDLYQGEDLVNETTIHIEHFSIEEE